MYNALIIAAVLLFLPLRFGFSESGGILFDFLGTKPGFEKIDFDLFPDLIACLILFVVFFAAQKNDDRFSTPKKLSAVMLVISLFTTVQFSGKAYYELFPGSYGKVLVNPTSVESVIYPLLETVLLILTLITFACVMDVLLDKATERQDHAAVQTALGTVRVYKNTCWIPMIVSIICQIVARDSKSDSVMLGNGASITLIVLRGIYFASLLFMGILVVRFIVRVRDEKKTS